MLITKEILVKFCTICMLGISVLDPMLLCVERTFHLVAIQRKGDVVIENVTQG